MNNQIIKTSVAVTLLALIYSSTCLAVLGEHKVESDDFGRGDIIDHVVGVENEARISADKEEICTGVLLRADVLLTAAHCFDHLSAHNSKMRVSFGALLGSQKRYIRSVHIHPQYVVGSPSAPSSKFNDLALVKVISSAYEPFKPVAKIVEQNQIISSQAPVRIVGYGQYKVGSGPAQRPGYRGEVTPVFLRTDSQQLTTRYYEPGWLIIDQTNEHGICKGDSGGPLFLSNDDGSFTLIGIARSIANLTQSNGRPTPTCGGIGIFTDLRPHLDWIQNTLKSIN